MNVYRFKLTRTMPLYSLTNQFFMRAEEKLLSLAREATPDDEALTLELSITDYEGQETMDTFASYPGVVPDGAFAAEFSVVSETGGLVATFSIHKEDPFECRLIISIAGAQARRKCGYMFKELERELSSFRLMESVNPSVEARSFSLRAPPMAVGEVELVELEGHLIAAAAKHVRLSPSNVAQDLRVTLELSRKTESYSSVRQLDGHLESVAQFRKLSLKLWVWNDDRKFCADVVFDRNEPRKCRVEIDCEGQGSRAAVDESRGWLKSWIEKYRVSLYPRHLLSGPGRAMAILGAMYCLLGSLLLAVEMDSYTGAILLGSFGGGLLFACLYGRKVWPYARLTSPKEEAEHRLRVGVFKYVTGSFLLCSIVVPTLLQLLANRT